VWRFLVELDETSGFRVCLVSDCLALEEFEESGGINLA
jgi:hypothetical protein